MAHLCKEELPFESKARLAAGAAGDPVAEVLVPSLSRPFDVCAAVGERLAARGVRTWRTDLQGTIHVELAREPARWPRPGYRIRTARP